jgi:hypothetical protein
MYDEKILQYAFSLFFAISIFHKSASTNFLRFLDADVIRLHCLVRTTTVEDVYFWSSLCSHIDGQITEGAWPEVVRRWEIQTKTLQHLWKL